jgi:SAM-dependent methyltransferase
VIEHNPEQARRAVSSHYADAVTQGKTSGCCGGNLAGYTEQERAALPAEAVDNSFGCGNPVAFSGVKPGDVVLDLGSGAGADLLLAAKIVGPEGRVIGVDMTDAMIAKARDNIRAAGAENADVRKGIIEDLPVAANSVDWVISNCVVNLSPEKAKVFSEIARVLKPGGQMLISDIVMNDVPEEFLAEAAKYTISVVGALSEEEYLAGLRAAGLADVKVLARLIYDASQIEGALLDIPKGNSALSAQVRRRVDQVVGKVWSAKFAARKPA